MCFGGGASASPPVTTPDVSPDDAGKRVTVNSMSDQQSGYTSPPDDDVNTPARPAQPTMIRTGLNTGKM